MTENLVNGLDKVTRAVKHCIYSENCKNGLLSDVNTIVPIKRADGEVFDEPLIWIVQHPTIQYDGGRANLSHTIKLQTTFEFVCVVYDEDIEIADYKGQNLATRVGQCILKNYNKAVQGERIIENVKFNTFYPVGEVNIEGKNEKTPATAIVFDFVHSINWLKCCQSKPSCDRPERREEYQI